MPSGKYVHRKWSSEEKRNRSLKMTGTGNPFFGKHHTNNTKKILSILHKNHPSLKKPKSEEHKEKIRQNALSRYKNHPERNPRWKGGNSKAFSTNSARKVCALEFCKVCSTNKNLLLHHINQNRHDNSPENIICLCYSCHNWLHRNDFDVVKRIRMLTDRKKKSLKPKEAK